MTGLPTGIAQGISAAMVAKIFPWYRGILEREIERQQQRYRLMALGLTDTEITVLEQQRFDLELVYGAVRRGEISAIRVKLNEGGK